MMEDVNLQDIDELLEDCIKVLLVNLATRKYTVYRVPQDEPVSHDTIDEYWQWFCESDLVHQEDKDKVMNFISKANIGKSVIYRRKWNDSYRIMIMELVAYKGSCLLFVKDITDIYNTELSLVVDKVQRLDSNTGLLNRKAFEEDVHRSLKGNVGVAYVDINGLKWTNNNNGHTAGDILIAKMVKLLKEQFPAYNIYRTGGDEFVIIGFNVKLRVFLHTVMAFHKRIWNDISVYTRGKYVGGLEGIYEKFPIASIGYSADCAEDIEDILLDAEKQMYEDKSLFYQKYPNYKR